MKFNNLNIAVFGNHLEHILKEKNYKAFAIGAVILLTWVEVLKSLARSNFLSTWTRRKVLHVGTGPIFFLVWSLFDGTITGSILAATLPLLMTSKFALIGLDALKDDDAVRTMSRTGDKKELLRGPLAYGAVFVITTLLFWKDFRSAIVIFSLCFGDGFAEPIGRIFGANNKLPWAKRSGKSLAGTMGFLTVSVAATSLLVAYLSKSAGRSTIVDDVLLLLPRITATNFFAALAESLTAGDLDNVAVFLAAVVADIGYCRLFPKTTASSQEWMKTVM